MTSTARAMFRADWDRVATASRFGGCRAAVHRGVWAMAVFRLGRALLDSERPLAGIAFRVYSMALVLGQVVTRIEIWPNTEVGPGVLLSPHGHIVVNAGVRIGAGATIGRGVTLGNVRDGDTATPILENGVSLGHYAQVYGPVRIGAGACVAPMSVVLSDVPAGAYAAGLPAKATPSPATEGGVTSGA